MRELILKLSSFAFVGVMASFTAPVYAGVLDTDEVSPVNNVDMISAFDDAFSSDSEALADRGDRHGRRVKRLCKAVNATDEQKAAIKAAAEESKEEAAGLKEDLKAAKKKYNEAIVADGDEAVANADSAAAEALTAKSGLIKGHTDLITNIMLNILKAEQRPAGLKCLKAIKRHHRRH